MSPPRPYLSSRASSNVFFSSHDLTWGLNHALYSGVKLFIFVAVNVGGWVGWSLGENFGLMTAFIASGVGSVLGVYVGWLAARRLLD